MSRRTTVRKQLVVIATGAAVLALGAVHVPAASAAPGDEYQELSPAQVDSAIADLEAQGVTHISVIDPLTGAVTRTVEADGDSARIAPIGPGCSTTGVCIPGNPPYGFQNRGVAKLNATNRAKYTSGSWTSQVRYTVPGAGYLGSIAAARQGPGGGAVFGGYVNVVQVQIF